jgi:hypothetical protein
LPLRCLCVRTYEVFDKETGKPVVYASEITNVFAGAHQSDRWSRGDATKRNICLAVFWKVSNIREQLFTWRRQLSSRAPDRRKIIQRDADSVLRRPISVRAWRTHGHHKPSRLVLRRPDVVAFLYCRVRR